MAGITMSTQQGISRDGLIATLQREKQAIFDMDTPGAENKRLWSQRIAELEAFLATDRISNRNYSFTQQGVALGGTTSDICFEQKRSFEPSCYSQQFGTSGSSLSPRIIQVAANKAPIRCSRSISSPSVDSSRKAVSHNTLTPKIPATLQHSSTDTDRGDRDIVFDPGDYIANKRNTDLTMSTAKRPRLDDVDSTIVPSLPVSLIADQLGSSTSTTLLTPVSSVSPGLSASSYHPSPYSSSASSFYGGEDMSRHSSSLSSTSMTDEFGMLRVESSGLSSLGNSLSSSFNQQQDDFSLLSHSVVSSMTEVPGSSSVVRAIPGLKGTNSLQSDLIRDLGCGFATGGVASSASPFSDSIPASEFEGHGMPWQMGVTYIDNSDVTNMQRNDSQLSASTSSSGPQTASQDKASARRLKHIANGASQRLLPKTLALLDEPETKPVVNQKQLIPRLPSQPKTKNPLTCPDCHVTFRGHHELTRHWENVHAPIKKVWVVVEAKSSPFKPKKDLAICKQCKKHKQYNVYYNAAAHLKRVHFCPSKRGRRRKGEPASALSSQEKGISPSIEQLKAHGWLKEIKVFNEGPGTVVDSIDDEASDCDAENDLAGAGEVNLRDENPTPVSLPAPQSAFCSSNSSPDLGTLPYQPIDSQQEAICMRTLGLQPMPFCFGDDPFSLNGYAGCDWPTAKSTLAAPIMEHSLSAPGRMGW